MSQHKEDNQNEYDDLEQLRQKVKLSSNKLLQLTYNDSKFVEKLVQLNLKAKELITQDYVEEALVYLGEAERVLQYGASCGKTIDRNIIICTLHNEACCYYKASDLVTASKYIEAVIFNIKTHLDSMNSSPSQSSASQQRGRKSDELMFVAVQKKIELVQYYLKYCTINSQAKNRIIALDASKRVVQVLKSLFTDIHQNQKIAVCEEGGQLQANDLRALLKEIKLFKEDLHLSQLDNYLALGRYWIKKWNQNKMVKKISFCLQKHISNYSISQVIDMLPTEYAGDNYEGNAVNTRCVMRQILHFSMGFFTISTEYRLISEQLYKKQQDRVRSEEYIKSNIYHLQAILFLAMHINCDLLFMKQIISSYEHHFKTILIQEETLNLSPQELAEKLLFDKPIQQPRKSINTSLMNKIKKLKSKSKQRKVHTEYEDTQIYESKACYKMNESKQKPRSKRSTSKPKLLGKVKKPAKVLNDSLLDSTKNLNVSKEERSIVGAKKVEIVKKRSVSKDSQPLKTVKSPIKIVEKASKKHNDEYQLGNAKCQVRKRTSSVASADLSCTIRDVNKTKISACEREQGKKAPKKKTDGKSKQKRPKGSKQTFSKHYYV